MIPLRDQESIRLRFETELKSRVRVDHFTQHPSPIYIPGRDECRFCGEAKTLVEEVASLSERLALTVHDFDNTKDTARDLGVDRVPATVIRGATNRPVRYYGMPTGTQFTGFVEALIEAGNQKVELQPETVKQLRRVKSDVKLQVLVTTNDAHSPNLAHLVLKFGLQSSRVKVDIIELSEFPALMQRYNVRAVPTTIFDEKLALAGAMDETLLAQVVLQVVEGKPISSTLRTGPATAVSVSQPQQRQGPRTSSSGLVLP